MNVLDVRLNEIKILSPDKSRAWPINGCDEEDLDTNLALVEIKFPPINEKVAQRLLRFTIKDIEKLKRIEEIKGKQAELKAIETRTDTDTDKAARLHHEIGTDSEINEDDAIFVSKVQAFTHDISHTHVLLPMNSSVEAELIHVGNCKAENAKNEAITDKSGTKLYAGEGTNNNENDLDDSGDYIYDKFVVNFMTNGAIETRDASPIGLEFCGITVTTSEASEKATLEEKKEKLSNEAEALHDREMKNIDDKEVTDVKNASFFTNKLAPEKAESEDTGKLLVNEEFQMKRE